MAAILNFVESIVEPFSKQEKDTLYERESLCFKIKVEKACSYFQSPKTDNKVLYMFVDLPNETQAELQCIIKTILID